VPFFVPCAGTMEMITKLEKNISYIVATLSVEFKCIPVFPNQVQNNDEYWFIVSFRNSAATPC